MCATVSFLPESPEVREKFRVFSPAFETRSMSRCEGCDLIEEKQFGVRLAPHHTMAVVEVKTATYPSPTDIAAETQGSVVAVKSSTPIA
jgi:hypothetical protein